MQIKRYQQGGATPAAPAPAPQGGEEQMMQQLAQMAQEIIQQLGPDAAAMLAQVIMEMLQGAPQEVGAAPEEQQFMRCGGKIKKTCKKACGGSVKKAACGSSIKKSACGGSVKKSACGGSVKKGACGGSVKKDACGGKTSKCKTKKSCK